jgi:hypothetical protein
MLTAPEYTGAPLASRSQLSEARLVGQFEIAAAPLAGTLGDLLILDDEDERVWFKAAGSFEAEVIPEADEGEEAEGTWKPLGSPEDLGIPPEHGGADGAEPGPLRTRRLADRGTVPDHQADRPPQLLDQAGDRGGRPGRPGRSVRRG